MSAKTEKNKTKRSFKGIWIPKAIWLSDLSLQEKVFLAEIDSLDNAKGCFASNAYFSRFFQVSKARCSQIITALEKKKLVTVKLQYKDKQVIQRKLRLAKGVVNILTRGSKYSKGGSKNMRSIDTSVISIVDDIDKSISVAPAKRNGKASIKKVNPAYFKLAKKLSKIIHTKKNITHTPIQIKAWSEELRKLGSVNKVSYFRQKVILKWYKNAIGGEYIPVVESGKSFREKFIKLEDAMNRKDFTKNSKLTNTYKDTGFKLTKKSIKI